MDAFACRRYATKSFKHSLWSPWSHWSHWSPWSHWSHAFGLGAGGTAESHFDCSTARAHNGSRASNSCLSDHLWPLLWWEDFSHRRRNNQELPGDIPVPPAPAAERKHLGRLDLSQDVVRLIQSALATLLQLVTHLSGQLSVMVGSEGCGFHFSCPLSCILSFCSC